MAAGVPCTQNSLMGVRCTVRLDRVPLPIIGLYQTSNGPGTVSAGDVLQSDGVATTEAGSSEWIHDYFDPISLAQCL